MHLPCQLESSQLKWNAFSSRGIPLAAWHSSFELRGSPSSVAISHRCSVYLAPGVQGEDEVGGVSFTHGGHFILHFVLLLK